MSSRARQAIGSLLSVGIAVTLVAAARADGPLPRLSGPPFAAPTHLHLIVAGAPPAIVDLDTGAVRAVPSITTSPYSQVRLLAMKGGALAIVHQACEPCATTTIRYATNAVGFRIGLDGSVARLGSGWSFLPARSSSAVWVLQRDASHRCRLRLVPSSRAALPAPCGFLEEDGQTGLLLSTRAGEMLLSKRTGRVRPASGGGRVSPRRDFAVEFAGESALEDGQLNLVSGGTRTQLRWPSILKWFDGWEQQPRGALLAVGFADPAYPGPAQAEDVWVLDPATRRFQHLPGFPAQADLKFSSWQWSDDGRLVLLLRGGGRTVAAVWTPGSTNLPVVPVELSPPTGAFGSFVSIIAS